EQQNARAIIVFIFAYWDEEIRPRLARHRGLSSVNQIEVDALGDLRLLRRAIIHNRGILSAEGHHKLKVMKAMFSPDDEIIVSHDHMHKMFVYVKQGIAKLIIDHTGPRPGTPEPSEIKDVAVQRKGKSQS